MRVILINGSPNKNGTTNKSLEIIQKRLEKNTIESDIFYLGNKAISGCIGCGYCNKNGKCFIDDKVNEFLDIFENYDGMIVASPVHFSSPSGFIIPFLDRLFYGKKNAIFRLKPFASIVCARRGGSSSSLDVLNKYGMFAGMIIVSSNYWNMVYGKNDTDIKEDLEGIQTLNVLADNMSYLLRLIESGKKNNIKLPELEYKIYTNFINKK